MRERMETYSAEHSSTARWRPMRYDDLTAVNQLGDEAHTNYPEDLDVFMERLAVYQAGCFTLNVESRIVGYVISHPWIFENVPPLNSYLTRIPQRPSTYYCRSEER